MSKPAALNMGVKITATKGDAKPPQDVQGRAPGAPPQEAPAAPLPVAAPPTVVPAQVPKKAGEKTELNPLSFKLRPDLDREFRREAFEADLKLVDFFEVVFQAWKDQKSNR